VPTAKELGIDTIVSSERGLAVPRGTPPAIVERLQKAIAAAVEDPEFYQGTNRDELQVSYLAGSEWEKSMVDRKVRYGDIIKKSRKTN
jgi:tripartite-type tricarboxylate transporter receptor subunit TctC